MARKKQESGRARADAVYMPVVHGIGVSSADAWTKTSVDRLVAWWTGTRRDVVAEVRRCGPACEMGDGHRHLALRGPDGQCRLDIEPIFWGHRVDRPGAWLAAWQVFQVVLLIGLVDLAAAAIRVLQMARIAPPQERSEKLQEGLASVLPEPARAFVEIVRTIGAVALLFVRAVLIPLLAPLAAALMFVGPVRRRVGDALAWSIDEGARGRVAEHVESTIARRRHTRVVLLGHSQGGSIVTELETALRRRRRAVGLVTLGSGHGLLAAVNRLLPGWALWRSALLWPLLVIYAIGLLVGLGGIVSHSLTDGGPFLSGLLRLSAVSWFSGMDPVVAAGLLENAQLEMTFLTSSDASVVTSPLMTLLSMTGLLVALVAVVLVGRRAAVLHATLRTGARGIDVIARRDPVSAVLGPLGDTSRVRRVRQCDSLVWDHVTYFDNEAVVLPLVAREVEQLAGVCLQVPTQPSDAERMHARALTARRAAGPLAVLGAMWLGSALFGWASAVVAAGAVIVAVVAAVAWRSLRLRGWLAGLSAPLRDGREVAELARLRARVRHPLWLCTMLFSATPMVAAGVLLAANGATELGIEDPQIVAVTRAGAVAGLVMLLTTWASAFGLRAASTCTTVALVLAAGGWLAQSTPAGMQIGVGLLILAGWNVVRQLRQGRRGRAPSAA